MSRKKLIRINAFYSLSNTLDKPFHLSGHWKDFFGNENPIIAELGCGKADFSVALAQQNPDNNFVAIDIKPDRLCVGAQVASLKNLKNIIFVKINLQDVDKLFDKEEVTSIWLTFPDPHPKSSSGHKRLTHRLFLEKYARILQLNSPINLKTDNSLLFEFTVNELLICEWTITFQETNCDLLLSELPELAFHTAFEKIYRQRGQRIMFIRAYKPETSSRSD